MKEEAKQQAAYEAPEVEIVEVEVEIGFNASGTGDDIPFD